MPKCGNTVDHNYSFAFSPRKPAARPKIFKPDKRTIRSILIDSLNGNAKCRILIHVPVYFAFKMLIQILIIMQGQFLSQNGVTAIKPKGLRPT